MLLAVVGVGAECTYVASHLAHTHLLMARCACCGVMFAMVVFNFEKVSLHQQAGRSGVGRSGAGRSGAAITGNLGIGAASSCCEHALQVFSSMAWVCMGSIRRSHLFAHRHTSQRNNMEFSVFQ